MKRFELRDTFNEQARITLGMRLEDIWAAYVAHFVAAHEVDSALTWLGVKR